MSRPIRIDFSNIVSLAFAVGGIFLLVTKGSEPEGWGWCFFLAYVCHSSVD